MTKYTNADDLAKYLGRQFDDDENIIADLSIEAAEIVIDRKTSVLYKQAGPQTFSVYQMPSPFVNLPGYGPYTLISVTGYTEFGSAGFLLQAGAQYEVRDANKGVLYFPDPNNWYRVDVLYTPTNIVPANIRLATNLLAAHYMRPVLNDEIPGLANYSVGSEFALAFTEYVQKQGYPAELDTLLGIPALYIA